MLRARALRLQVGQRDRGECGAEGAAERPNPQIFLLINRALLRSYEQIVRVSADQLQLPPQCEWAMRHLRPTDGPGTSTQAPQERREPPASAASSAAPPEADYWQGIGRVALYTYSQVGAGACTRSGTLGGGNSWPGVLDQDGSRFRARPPPRPGPGRPRRRPSTTRARSALRPPLRPPPSAHISPRRRA